MQILYTCIFNIIVDNNYVIYINGDIFSTISFRQKKPLPAVCEWEKTTCKMVNRISTLPGVPGPPQTNIPRRLIRNNDTQIQ